MPTYRVKARFITERYITAEFEAENVEEAADIAQEMCDNGTFDFWAVSETGGDEYVDIIFDPVEVKA